MLAAALAGREGSRRGLLLTVEAPDASVGPRLVRSVDLRDLRDERGRLLPGPLSARWEGFWLVEEPGTYRLLAHTAGRVRVAVGGTEILSGGGRPRGVIGLEPGLHALRVDFEGPAGPRQLRLEWSHVGEPREELDPGALRPARPSAGAQAWDARARALRAGALAAALAALPALLVPALLARRRAGRWPRWVGAAWTALRGRRARRIALVAAPVAVTLVGAALRFEALVGRYYWGGPRWAVEAARAVESLHPLALRWEPTVESTGGDPYHYYRRAQAMEGFYEADVREPVFPFATRALIRVVGETGLAVNAASAVFSMLVVPATYLLGSAAFSPAVGLGAALAMAVDRDALWWGVEGFRDDAFTLSVLLSAWSLVQLRRRPSIARAVLAGLAGGVACLTRITALSFLAPAGAWLAWGRGDEVRARRRALALAAGAAVVVAGPYLLACALAYGDPLHAVNFHTRFYRSRTGLPYDSDMSWVQYLRTGFPAGELARTGLAGLTVYPFGNKWSGLDPVSPLAGMLLSVAAVAGLLLWLRSWPGRLLLVVLLGSLLPYAFTWRVPGGAEWRFTMHAYPFYLIASWVALVEGARALRRAWAGRAQSSGGAAASASPML